MRIVRLEDIKSELQQHLRNRSLFPVIGSGFTKGCKSDGGRGEDVPTGQQMKEYMIRYLADHGHKISKEQSFAKVARYYEKIADPSDYWRYFKTHFVDVILPDSRRSFLDVSWKLVYTLNLDDAIENNSVFQNVILPGKDIRIDALENSPCVFKLHGDAKELIRYLNDNKVLSITEYISSLTSSKSMLEKLSLDLNYSNALFVGCSLTDELDLLSVAQQLKKRSGACISRYIVMRKEPDTVQTIDLEDFGIDTVIITEDYELFYDQFAEIAGECKYVFEDELDEYHNFSIANVPSDKSVEYLVSGRFLFDKKTGTINFPAFFVERNIESQLLSEMTKWRIQIINGARISGKSYLLAGLTRKIRNRDVYYFDSRSHIDEKLLLKILEKDCSVLLLDTNVLSKAAMRTLLSIPEQYFHKHSINIFLCVNNSDKEVFQIIRDNSLLNHTSYIKRYELNKYLNYNRLVEKNMQEGDILNYRLKMLGITTFVKTQTILDNLIRMQSEMRAKTPTKFDIPIQLSIDDSEKLSLLILLVMNEKVTAKELVQCGLMQTNADLLKELKISIEEDHCRLLSLRNVELVDYQVVCNAHVWLLEQLRVFSANARYTQTFKNAFSLIVSSFLNGSEKYKNVEDYVKFDRLNELFKNGKRLIQEIYEDLRPLLINSYQYYHQYAKCKSWGMSKSNYDYNDLEKARISAVTALRMIEEYDYKSDTMRKMAHSHILNTISIIYAKMCFFEEFSEEETVIQASLYLLQAINCVENSFAMRTAKYSVDDTKEEEGGVIKKWIEYTISHSDHIPLSAKKNISLIMVQWGML